MKVIYDKEVDVLKIIFNELPIQDSDEEKKGVILDYDANGQIVSIEILNASKKMPQPNKLEYEVA